MVAKPSKPCHHSQNYLIFFTRDFCILFCCNHTLIAEVSDLLTAVQLNVIESFNHFVHFTHPHFPATYRSSVPYTSPPNLPGFLLLQHYSVLHMKSCKFTNIKDRIQQLIEFLIRFIKAPFFILCVFNGFICCRVVISRPISSYFVIAQFS